ncbi:MAG: DUF1624 domain-containing protein [Bacteroidetes bacterium]|nr:DUF1624 domain-containing protein [Bacteroidota bacterium]
MKQRFVFIDLLRGWATIVMIEVHVFNAFLTPTLKETSWFGFLTYVNGLVAPSFIFISGFVFLIASQRKLEEFRKFGSTFWKQVQRIGIIWLVGYLLHLPHFSLNKTLHETTEADWLRFYQADVLHCIALGLLILFVFRLFIRSDVAYKNVLLGTGIAFIVLTPFLWDLDFYRMLPSPIAAYLSGERYSQFPVFPWLGFMMFGGFCAVQYLSARELGREKNFVIRLAIGGFACLAGGLLFSGVLGNIPFASLDIRANTFFFLERLGIVLLLLVVCWLFAEWRKTPARPPSGGERSFVLDVSRESLFVYAAHLMTIYGLFLSGKSFSGIYGGTFDIIECSSATLVLTGCMILAAKTWGWLKHRHIPLARGFSFATAFVFLYLFVTQ